MPESNLVEVNAEEIVSITALVMLITVNGQDFWLPKSQVEDADDYREGERDVIVYVPEWLARKEGLEYD